MSEKKLFCFTKLVLLKLNKSLQPTTSATALNYHLTEAENYNV